MSRSYRKQPWNKDHNKFGKKSANRKVRRKKFDLPAKGSGYKKYFCQYDICDGKYRRSWSELVRWWERDSWMKKRYPTLKELYHYWWKIYKAK